MDRESWEKTFKSVSEPPVEPLRKEGAESATEPLPGEGDEKSFMGPDKSTPGSRSWEAAFASREETDSGEASGGRDDAAFPGTEGPGSSGSDLSAEQKATGEVPSSSGSGQDNFDTIPPPGSGEGGASPPGDVLPDELKIALDNIWANMLVRSSNRPNTFLFCGSAREEGTTFTCFHLSLYLATEYHMKVLYVETGRDDHAEHPYLPGLRSQPGLISFFREDQPLRSLVCRTPYKSLFVIPSGLGKVQGRSGPVITYREQIKRLVYFCRSHFDATIFDAEPVLLNAGTVEFAKVVEEVVMVCRYGHSRREVILAALDKLKENGVVPVGFVFNDRQYPIHPSIYGLLR